MLETIGFGVGLIIALAAGWGLLVLIAKGWAAEEERAFDRERQSDLEAVRKNPTAYQFDTIAGRVWVGPGGRLFRHEDVYPMDPAKVGKAERASELRP